MIDPRITEGARLAAAETAARHAVSRRFAELSDRSDSNHPATRAWREAIARWNDAFALVYPEAFWAAAAALKQVRHRDVATRRWIWREAPPESIETAVRFLEADLDCFRSGYVKERLIRHLVRQQLDDDALSRLRMVVSAALDRPARREFRALCRLAIRVADEALMRRVEAAAAGGDDTKAARARWMRDAVLRGRSDGRARRPPPAAR